MLLVAADVARPWSWPLPTFIVAAAAGIAGAVTAIVVDRARLGARTPGARPVQTASVGASSWSESSVTSVQAAITIVAAGIMLASGLLQASLGTAMGWVLMVMAPGMAVLAIPSAMRVTVDRRGLTVCAMLLGLPIVRVPLDQVADAEAGLILARDWGGVGLIAERDRTGAIHRDGAALLVTRTDGTEVVVTVDRPDEAAAELLAQRERQWAGRGER